MSYHSGGDPVHESDFSDVLEVLAGPSPWKEYIGPNLQAARDAKRGSFKVLDVTSFNAATGFGTNVPGVTNKLTGDIVMQQWSQPGFTYLLAALHECVHWVSAPASQGAGNTLSAAHGVMGEGILEGLVEIVARDILKEQRIALPNSPGMLGHPERVPIVQLLMETTGVHFFARPLFREQELAQFNMVMNFTYSQTGFGQIRAFATAKQTEAARNAIRNFRRQEEERRRAADQELMRRLRAR